MTTTAGEQMRPFYDAWRAVYPNTFTRPLEVREDSIGAAFHIESGVENGQPWTCVRAGYGPIKSGQATHEIMGHMLRRILGDAVWEPFWAARFAGCASAPKTYAEHVLDLNVQRGVWAYLPIEIFAEAARIAFDPDSPIDAFSVSRADRSMDWGCAIDGARMRTFFESYLGGPPVAVATAPIAPAASAPVAPHLVVDYYAPHDAAFMQCLKANGIDGIARYLTAGMGDPRQVTRQEIADAHAAGLAVHFVYEMNPTFAGYFNFAQGAEDCRQAVARLGELGAPEGTVVYFAVDTNVDPGIVDAYIAGVESMVTPQIVPGVYGFARLIDHARLAYRPSGAHLWQTYGIPRGPLDLWQHEQRALCGVSVDVNDSAVSGWRKDQEMDRATFNQWFREQYFEIIDPTIVSMKKAYDPLIVAAKANGLLDAAQQQAIDDAHAELEALRTGLRAL